MDLSNTIQLLINSGFNVKGTDSTMTYLLVEDPSCIIRNLEMFIHYAWIILSLITAILLFGWAISKIRGANTDVTTNIRNLVIIFGVLSAVGPIINMIFGGDLMGRQCKIIQIPIAEVNEMLARRNAKLSPAEKLYENIDIIDYGYDGDMLEDIPPIDVPTINLQPDPDNPGEYIIAPVSNTDVDSTLDAGTGTDASVAP